MVILLAIASFVFVSCVDKEPDASQIIEKAMQAHGSTLLKNSLTTFHFRGTAYSIERDKGTINFSRTFFVEGDTIKDIKTNSGVTRYRNGTQQTIADSILKKYDSSINSVAYFSQLPYSLDGPAVIKKYLGMDTIKGKKYHEIEVTFDENGGGEDHEDVFVYWVNEQSHLLDYLAYSYCEADCGYRFRESVNRTTHNGVIMQDYKNYKATARDPQLQHMDDLFEDGKLELLSEIINEDVTVVLTD